MSAGFTRSVESVMTAGCDAHGTYVHKCMHTYNCIPAEIISVLPVEVTFLARNNVHILKELL